MKRNYDNLGTTHSPTPFGSIQTIYLYLHPMHLPSRASKQKKRLGKLLISTVLSFMGLLLTCPPLLSQNASNLYYFTPNKTATKTIYDAKNKIKGTQEYRVSHIDKNNSKKVNGTYKKFEEEKLVSEETSIYIDKGNSFLKSMGKNKQGEMIYMDYPLEEKITNTTFSDLEFATTTTLAGQKVTVNCNIRNRKIDPKAKIITTALGSWRCIKISYNLEIKSFGVPINLFVEEWFSNKIGVVVTDVYKSDKLYERPVLTDYK